eukprot:CFRG8329T1
MYVPLCYVIEHGMLCSKTLTAWTFRYPCYVIEHCMYFPLSYVTALPFSQLPSLSYFLAGWRTCKCSSGPIARDQSERNVDFHFNSLFPEGHSERDRTT